MPPKKPFEFVRRPATREVEGPTVVPNPIPQEEVRRRVPPAAMRPPQADPPHTEAVPGEPVVLDEVTVQGETVEMIDGAPRVLPTFTRKPLVPTSWPIHLTSQVVLRPTQSGSPNLQALRAPQDKWLRIDAIKMEASIRPSDNAGVAFSTNTSLGLGAVVAASFMLKDKPLTSGFVPVAMFGPSRKLTAERLGFIEPGQAQLARAEEYVWPLAAPIYVPPGGVLEPVCEHRGYLQFLTRVRISYEGALLNVPPSVAERSRLPFASSWVSQALTLDGAHNLASSAEKDIIGPAGVEFHVEYLLGRVYVAYQDVNNRTILELDFDTNFPASIGMVTAMTDQVEVRLAGSWGTALVPDYARFPAIFDRVNRQLIVPHTMPADGYYLVGIRSNGQLDDAAALALVSAIGWQEVTP